MKIVGKIGLLIGLATIAFASGFAFMDLRNGEAPSAEAFTALVKGEDAAPTPTETFTDHYSLIANRHLRDLPDDELRYSAMGGMFAALGDPHTVFLRPEVAEEFSLENNGDFVGIGARLGEDPLGALVATVFEDAPADRAGIRPNDIIIAVDGEKVAGETVTDIVSRIRGEEGTVVKLTLLRKGSADPLQISVTRAEVQVPSAEGRILNDAPVGYISVTQFSESTTGQFEKDLRKILSRNPEGLVIDMRSNPGGLLDTASKMLGFFAEGKTVVTTVGRNERSEKYSTPRGKSLGINLPIAILIDGQSASAAEIFAGAMQDYGLAELVGTHSYGKASVQNVIPLIDKSSAKITIAKYLLPKGRDISRKVDADGVYISGGIDPDHEVELEEPMEAIYGEWARDSQLRYAADLVMRR